MRRRTGWREFNRWSRQYGRGRHDQYYPGRRLIDRGWRFRVRGNQYCGFEHRFNGKSLRNHLRSGHGLHSPGGLLRKNAWGHFRVLHATELHNRPDDLSGELDLFRPCGVGRREWAELLLETQQLIDVIGSRLMSLSKFTSTRLLLRIAVKNSLGTNHEPQYSQVN